LVAIGPDNLFDIPGREVGRGRIGLSFSRAVRESQEADKLRPRKTSSEDIAGEIDQFTERSVE